jgi:hypothetical protein
LRDRAPHDGQDRFVEPVISPARNWTLRVRFLSSTILNSSACFTLSGAMAGGYQPLSEMLRKSEMLRILDVKSKKGKT